MITFTTNIPCPKCGRRNTLVFSNNPLSGTTICYECLKQELNYEKIEHGEFFCRTYNLPWKPDLWLELSKVYQDEVFKEYTSLVLEDTENQPNLAYESSTRDLWTRTNKEWEKCRSFAEIMNKIKPIKESYMLRAALKWGNQYTFEELIKLDSIYSRTIKSNNITNPLQKEAVKTLCKLQVEMDEAIKAKDAKAIKDFSSAWSTFAKQADLETMINETKTDDITTVAELYQYMEEKGFRPTFYDGFPKDEVDQAIKDIQDSNRRLILEATGLEQTLKDMAEQRMQTKEEEYTKQVVERENLQELLDFKAEDAEIATENDEDAQNLDFKDGEA